MDRFRGSRVWLHRSRQDEGADQGDDGDTRRGGDGEAHGDNVTAPARSARPGRDFSRESAGGLLQTGRVGP